MASLSSLFEKQRGLCFYCRRKMSKQGHRGDSITRDHLTPRCRGGGIVVGACWRCNNLKGELSAAEFQAVYATLPLPERRPTPPEADAAERLRRSHERERRRAEVAAMAPVKLKTREKAGYDPAAVGLKGAPIGSLAESLPGGYWRHPYFIRAFKAREERAWLEFWRHCMRQVGGESRL